MNKTICPFVMAETDRDGCYAMIYIPFMAMIEYQDEVYTVRKRDDGPTLEIAYKGRSLEHAIGTAFLEGIGDGLVQRFMQMLRDTFTPRQIEIIMIDWPEEIKLPISEEPEKEKLGY